MAGSKNAQKVHADRLGRRDIDERDLIILIIFNDDYVPKASLRGKSPNRERDTARLTFVLADV